MKTIPSSKSNPCPVCASNNGACRVLKTGAVFCHGHSDARLGEEINGYRCTKVANGHTATFVVCDSDQQQTEQTYVNDISTREISLDDRDRGFRQILGELQLDEKHRDRLKSDRGLSDDEIDKGMFRSIAPRTRLNGDFSGIPGVNAWNQLIALGNGILIPVTINGKIAGLKIRLDQPDKNGNRYQWCSSGGNVKLSGETPLPIYKGSGDTAFICEGQGFKPYILSSKIKGWVAGGGRFWHHSPVQAASLIAQLHESGVSSLFLCPDGGDVINAGNVASEWLLEAEYFQGKGFDVKFEWHDQYRKNSLDIDELDDYKSLKFIEIEDFRAIVDEFDLPEIKNWQRSLKFSPDVRLNSQYLKMPSNLPKSGYLIGVKSGLGTGKTQAFGPMINDAEKGALLLGYRNNLLFQTIARLAEFKCNIYHLNEEDGDNFLADDTISQALCVNSLAKCDGYFDGRNVYIDEVKSVIEYILSGGTLGDRQGLIIRLFIEALQKANNIYVFDANLSDGDMRFLANLCPDKSVLKIENEHKPVRQNFKIVNTILDDEIKKKDKSPLFDLMRCPGNTPFIYCDSKELSKRIDHMMKDKGRVGYVLNKDTSGEKWAKELLENPDQFIRDHKPEYLIFSPTAESGISVGDSILKDNPDTVNGHFNIKFSLFQGVNNTSSMTQALMRLRDESLEHYVYVPNISYCKDRSSPQAYCEKRYKEIQRDRDAINYELLLESADEDQRELVEKCYQEAMKRSNREFILESQFRGSLDNIEQNNYRRCFKIMLNRLGHDWEEIELESNQEMRDAEKIAKDEILLQHSRELFEAVPFEDVIKAKELARKNPGIATARRIEKTFLLDELPGIEHSDQWGELFIRECVLKRKTFIRGIERFLLVQNFDLSKHKHQRNYFYHLTQQDFYKARLNKTDHATIWALKELGIVDFALNEEAYTKDSASVLDIIVQLRSNAKLRSALRMESMKPTTESNSEVLEILAKLLNLIGFKNKFIRKEIIDGVRVNVYESVPMSDTSFSIFNASVEAVEKFSLTKCRETIIQCLSEKLEKKFSSADVQWVEASADPVDPVDSVESVNEAEDIPDGYAIAVFHCDEWIEGTFKVWGCSDRLADSAELQLLVNNDFIFVPADMVVMAA